MPLTATVPDYGSNATTTWGEWFATWHPNWVVIDGELVDMGWYDWEYKSYSATLKIDYTLAPDGRVKTAYKSNDHWVMKSGYAVNALCKVVVQRDDGAADDDIRDGDMA